MGGIMYAQASQHKRQSDTYIHMICNYTYIFISFGRSVWFVESRDNKFRGTQQLEEGIEMQCRGMRKKCSNIIAKSPSREWQDGRNLRHWPALRFSPLSGVKGRLSAHCVAALRLVHLDGQLPQD